MMDPITKRLLGLLALILVAIVATCALAGCQYIASDGQAWTAGPTKYIEYSEPNGGVKVRYVVTGVWDTKVGSIRKTQDGVVVENWTSEEKMSENMGKVLDLLKAAAAAGVKP